MKKLFTALLITVAVSAQSQYLPNSSFDSWKGSCGSTDAAGSMIQRPGVEPSDWNGSSVNQMGQKKELVFNDNYSVKLRNAWVGLFGIGSTAPGYITLGTPWVYASMTLSDCDGGTYGGVPFGYRPDAITGSFKREDSNGENSYIVAYMWKGTFTSKIGKKSGPDQSRDNVERAILGMVTPSSSGALVAKCNYSFSSTGGGWETITVPIEYINDEVPEMMNVVICGGDYWNRGNLTDGTTLFVDNVQFVYYSELASLYYDGVSHFLKGKTSYNIDADYDESKLSVTTNGKGATIEKSFDDSSKLLTITIKGNDYAANKSSFHKYTIQFRNDGVVGPDPDPTPEPTPGDTDYTPAFTGEKTRSDRWIESVALTSEEYAGEAANTLNVDNSGNLCYNDYTGSVTMKAAAGETVTLALGIGEASWMNAFVYIDSDNDGFTASIADGSSYQPAGDLVSYSFYNNGSDSDMSGWNSAGTVFTGDSRSTVGLPSFEVPSVPGTYRVRVKLDWCNIDPRGDSDGKFGDFMDNGGQIVDFMLEVAGEEVDYTPANTGTRNYPGRNITAIKMQSATHGEHMYELSSSEQIEEYLDLTGNEFRLVAAPGEQVSVELVTEGSWINHYLYIDFGADGFAASIADGSDYQPAGDLVSYSFYNNGGDSDERGWNSDGTVISGDDRANPVLPVFSAPAETGTYRMRIKQDWCSIDPMGDSDSNFGGTFSNYGGQIIDVNFVVSAETGIGEVDTENSKVEGIYDLQGRKVEQITAPGLYIVNGKKILVK